MSINKEVYIHLKYYFNQFLQSTNQIKPSSFLDIIKTNIKYQMNLHYQ
jgi:hypothetical protein